MKRQGNDVKKGTYVSTSIIGRMPCNKKIGYKFCVAILVNSPF